MGGTLPYRLFLPSGYDTPGAEFPLVLRLHGSGGRSDDNISQLQGADGLINATQSERFASFLLLPQAPSGSKWDDDSSDALSPSMEMVTQIITPVGVAVPGRYVAAVRDGVLHGRLWHVGPDRQTA